MFVQLFTPSKIAYFCAVCIRLNAFRAVLRYYSGVDMHSYSLERYKALEGVTAAWSDILELSHEMIFSYRRKIFAIYRKLLDRKIHKIFT